MYAATILMFLSIPLILGSLISFLVFLIYPILIVKRIKNEEKVLEAEAIERMADAKKYEQIALAEGQKTAMDNINMAMANSKFAAEYLLTQGRVEAFSELAKNGSKDKILVPYETSELIGSLSVIKDFLSSKKEIKWTRGFL